MTNSNTISYAASATFAALLLAGCSAGASSAFGSPGLVQPPRSEPRAASPFRSEPPDLATCAVRPDHVCRQCLYFSDYHELGNRQLRRERR